MHATTETDRYTSTRPDAWHQLGTNVEDCTTAYDAMKQGGLTGWDVRKVQLLAQDSGLDLPVHDTFAIVRNDPARGGALNVLGTVGREYNIRQNEDMAALLDALVEETGADFTAAGTIDGGRRAFITLRLPGGAKIASTDPVAFYLSVLVGHDGNFSSSVAVTPVHVGTGSVLNLRLGSRASQIKLRPGSGSSPAGVITDRAFKYLDRFGAHAGQLAQRGLTQRGFDDLITKAYGAADDAHSATATRRHNKLEQMSHLFHLGSGIPEGVRGTAWAGLITLAAWHDHHSPVRAVRARSGEDNTPGAEARMRARKALLDPGFKDSALLLMMGA